MSGGGGAGLMSCVREGSLEPPYRPPAPHTHTHTHGEGRTGRFFRGLRRIFKRRGSGARADASPDPKSSSTSELLDAERHARRKEGAYGSGLSVSHDSVFTGERSGDESSDERATPAHGLAHIASSHRAELVAAVRRRGRGDGSDDDDEGVPQSPPASPPTDKADKLRHHAGISQSSCSDGSLLSVGSSEMDEDSSSGHHHDHARADQFDSYNTSEPPSGVAPLSHSAAKHKMAVRPRRTHGAPRRKKNNPIAASALPITPELNEEMIRSATPDVAHKNSEVVTESFSSSTTKHQSVTIREQQFHMNRELQRVLETPADTRLKSSSLPPGMALAPPAPAPAPSPRSSIKRSQSSSQGHPPRDSPKSQPAYRSEDRMTKYRPEKKHAEESCPERKTKAEKRTENEVIRSSRREESFFSRLLLRKSGKKSRKEPDDGREVKKCKTDRPPAHYKPVDDHFFEGAGPEPGPAERTTGSAAQKAFSNQPHKRVDPRGGYSQDRPESAYKDVYGAVKLPGLECDVADLRAADETDKMLNQEMRNRFSRREEFIEKMERAKRNTTRDIPEPFVLPERARRPASMHRPDPFSSKAFISNEIASRAREELLSPSLVVSDDEPPIRATRLKPAPSDMFAGGPKNLPYYIPSSPKLKPPSSDRHRSSELISAGEILVERKRETFHLRTEEASVSGLRSLGDEFVESRSGIGKSHSFRYASETASMSSQENQLPSLPTVVGISEPLLESWEVNYRRNLDRPDLSKRLSARNYTILAGDAEYDSLPSTDSSYLDSLKTDVLEDRKLFASLHVVDNKRDSDISQIEAKIDDIISSPKPIISPILKSSSMDSVKSSPEKHVDDRRKTISESFISVTQINREPVKVDAPKLIRSDEKVQKSGKPGVPEFLNIQLNKVDAKPTTHIVLTANVTPKKSDVPQVVEKEPEYECVTVELTPNPVKKEVTIVAENTESNLEIKGSPVLGRKSVIPVPQSPSTPKAFFKRKAASVDYPDKMEKSRTNSISTDGSSEKIFDNISIGQKSHSSFGSKSSIQSTDSNDTKPPDRNEEAVILRKKPIMLSRELRGEKKDDEPELMKVFARRSLKIKDTEADAIAQEIAATKEEDNSAAKSKMIKNEFNASIKSRDSDKENEETKEEEERLVDIAARVSQFGVPHYQRSVSIHSVNPKRESAPNYRSEVNKYKKEVSDSTPEKRLRNRTFPDPSNDREDIKSIAKNDFKADTLTKRPWTRNENRLSVEKEKRESAVIEKDGDGNNKENEEGAKEKDGADGEADASPQFKGILQMRAEWERRAKQGMTK